MKESRVSVELRPIRDVIATGKSGPSRFVSDLIQPLPTDSETLSGTLRSLQEVPVGALDTLEWGKRLNGPHDAVSRAMRSSHDESIRAFTILPVGDTISMVPSLKFPYMNRWRAAACLIGYFTQGLNDSVVGALLPYMERRYRVSYAVVSVLFMARTLGFLTAGPFTHKLNNRFGRSKTLATCAASNMLAFILITTSPPYPLVALAFYLSGYGFATISALDNVFIINLQGGTVLLGFMQGFYGIGGTIAPFVATLMISKGARWSYFYILPLALSALSAAAFFLSFRGYENEETTIRPLANANMRHPSETTAEAKPGILRKALTNKTTLLAGLLVAAYQGAEVSISGWVISFLIDYRKGDPDQVGYVTSGFWGGITLGRFLLVMPAHKFGDRISLIVLTVATIGFQIMLWLLPDIIGDAVAVAIIGLLQGPIYPCATGVFARLLPTRLQVTSLGLITGMGSSGGALGPFCTGLLAQRLGTVVLNPVCIVLYVTMLGSWLGLPTIQKRTS